MHLTFAKTDAITYFILAAMYFDISFIDFHNKRKITRFDAFIVIKFITTR